MDDRDYIDLDYDIDLDYGPDKLRKELEEKKKELEEFYKLDPTQESLNRIKRKCTFDQFWDESSIYNLSNYIDDQPVGRNIILSAGWTLREYDIAYAEMLLADNATECAPLWGFWGKD